MSQSPGPSPNLGKEEGQRIYWKTSGGGVLTNFQYICLKNSNPVVPYIAFKSKGKGAGERGVNQDEGLLVSPRTKSHRGVDA